MPNKIKGPQHVGWTGDSSAHSLAAIKGHQTRRRNQAIGKGISPEQADFNQWFYGAHDVSQLRKKAKDPRRVEAGKKSARTRADRAIKGPAAPKTPKTGYRGNNPRTLHTTAGKADVTVHSVPGDRRSGARATFDALDELGLGGNKKAIHTAGRRAKDAYAQPSIYGKMSAAEFEKRQKRPLMGGEAAYKGAGKAEGRARVQRRHQGRLRGENL